MGRVAAHFPLIPQYYDRHPERVLEEYESKD
jgi:hypothetical protein